MTAARRRLGHSGCRDLIAAATCADDAEHSKPCPDIFEAARGKLGDVRADEAAGAGAVYRDVAELEKRYDSLLETVMGRARARPGLLLAKSP